MAGNLALVPQPPIFWSLATDPTPFRTGIREGSTWHVLQRACCTLIEGNSSPRNHGLLLTRSGGDKQSFADTQSCSGAISTHLSLDPEPH